MIRYVFICAFALLLLNGCGQTRMAGKTGDNEEAGSTKPGEGASVVDECGEVATQDEVDRLPAFPDGEAGVAMYFYRNLRIPDPHREIEKGGLFSFLVDCKGHTQNFRIINSINDDIDREIQIAILNMPDWQPALKNDQVVNYRVCLKLQVIRGSMAIQPQRDCE